MAEKNLHQVIQAESETLNHQQQRERQILEINHQVQLDREYREYQRENNLDYYEDYLPPGMEPYKWG